MQKATKSNFTQPQITTHTNMKFLTEDDFIVYADTDTIEQIINLEGRKELVRNRSEKAAIEEVNSYLHKKFETSKIYEKTGDQRNETIIKCLVNITVWHFYSKLDSNQVPEVKKIRYDETITELEKIRDGISFLDCEKKETNKIVYIISEPKQDNQY